MLKSDMISSSSLNSHTPTTPFIHHHLLATHNSLQKPFILLLKEWKRWEERERWGEKGCVCVYACVFKREWRKKVQRRRVWGLCPPPTHTVCAGQQDTPRGKWIPWSLSPGSSPALNPPCPLLATVLTQTHAQRHFLTHTHTRCTNTCWCRIGFH